MGTNFYNDEEVKFKETIDSLKSLPKVNAADNFEYNLMVKIKNQNFELKSENQKKSIFWKILPAPAVVAAAILAFFLIPEETIETNNLLQFSPIQVIDSAKQAQLSTQSSAFGITGKQVNKTEKKSEDKNTVQAEEKTYRMNVKPNDVAVKEKTTVPFDPSKEVDIDKFIDGKTITNSKSSPANLVSGGDKSSQFERFIIKNKEEKDSLVKAKQDSLQLDRKIKQKK